MNFVETDLFGVYVAPISLLMLLAYALLFGIRRVMARLGWFDVIWFPGLFELALYIILLSALILLARLLPLHV